MEIDIQQYQLHGRHCPHCTRGTYKALEMGEMLIKGNFQTYFLLECLDCGFLWNEIYGLDKIEEELYVPSAREEMDWIEDKS